MSAFRIREQIDSEGILHIILPENMRNQGVVVTVEPVGEPGTNVVGDVVREDTGTVRDLLRYVGIVNDASVERPLDGPVQERDFGW